MVNILSIARKNIIFCKSDDEVPTIAQTMVDYDIGSVLIKNEKGKFIGLIDDKMLFRLLTTGENPIPKKAREIMIPLIIINQDLDIEEAWEEMEKVQGERFCVVDDNTKVIGIVKKKTIGYLRLKHLKQKLGIQEL